MEGDVSKSINLVFCLGGDPIYSYGKIELKLYRKFMEHGVNVTPIGKIHPDAYNALTPTERAYRPTTIADVSLIIGRPNRADNYAIQNTRKWLYTMSESTRVSDEWVEYINRTYEKVFVPVPDLVEVYKNSGIPMVECLPLGVDYVDVPPPGTGPAFDKPFIFLTHSNGDMRKGAELALIAFQKLFGDDRRYQIWVKALHTRGCWLEGCQNDNIIMLPGHMSEANLNELYGNVHAFVWPTRGEGFGLMAREATLHGTPAIATEWMGLSDIARWGYPIDVKELRPSQFELVAANHPDGEWAEPDARSLEYQMNYVAKYYKEAREHALAGREVLLSHYTYDKMIERLTELL